MEAEQRTLQAEYDRLKSNRTEWLTAAQEAAKLTIPAIMPDNAEDKFTVGKKVIKTPNQAIGADGVNNLAAKVTMTILPPNQTFFKFKMDKAAVKEAALNDGADEAEYESNINQGLAQLESLLLDYMESFSDRVCLGEALKHLYITGNVLLLFDSKGAMRYYPLSRYVIKRDYSGNPQEVIAEETIAFNELPEKIRIELLKKYIDKPEEECPKEFRDKEFTLYTGFKRTPDRWITHQEVDNIKVEGSEGKFPIDVQPFIALRYCRVDGESYGRGLIEEYYGDLSYLDTLCLAIRESSLAASKLLMLVNPAGATKIRQLANAKNGDFVSGKSDDVVPLQANKYNDLATAQQEVDKIERRLNRVFVMQAAIQRDAERVDIIALYKLF